MTGDRLVWLLVAAGVLLAFLAPLFGPLAPFIFLAALMDFAIAFAYHWMLKARRDPYSLSALREQMEKDELEEYEEPVLETDQVLCPQCHSVYESRFPICPHCAKRK